MPSSQDIAVVGATGAVGREVLAILGERGVAASRVRALASANSEGAPIPLGGDHVRVERLHAGAFKGIRLAVFAASSEVALEFAPAAIAAGATVIDNSSAFRMYEGVPLVVPEVNREQLSSRPDGTDGPPSLIANPNCSAVILSVALEPLRSNLGLESVNVATYQAVSGAGLGAMAELTEQAGAVLKGVKPTPKFFKEPCAFNVFSHDSAVDPLTGCNVEEQKIIDELRRIWCNPRIPISPTCVRVPVLRAHTQAIHVRLKRPISEQELSQLYRNANGIKLVDDRAANSFPTPLKASGQDQVLVGRLRLDPGVQKDESGRSNGVCLLACGDQLRKGAATNALQIADLLGLLSPPERPACSTPKEACTIVR